MYSLRNLALDFGLSHCYFYVVKKNQRYRFDFMFSFDKNRTKSLYRYLDYIKDLNSKVEKILYEWDDRAKEFSEIMINAGYETKINHKHICQLYYGIDKTVHRLRADDSEWIKIDYPVIQRWKKIVDTLGDKYD